MPDAVMDLEERRAELSLAMVEGDSKAKAELAKVETSSN
jgi:hypothetical protein